MLPSILGALIVVAITITLAVLRHEAHSQSIDEYYDR